MTISRSVCPYVAIPAFVSRHFRHSAIFIRTDRNIRGPADLKGKLVGLPEYQQTANVWMRGIFKEEYGVEPQDIHWRTGGQEEPGRDERTPLKLGKNIDLQPIAAGKTLNKMLVDGELDAVFSARELSCFVNRAPNVGLMFPNYREVEKEYYKRSGMFPIMHVISKLWRAIRLNRASRLDSSALEKFSIRRSSKSQRSDMAMLDICSSSSLSE